MYQTFEVIIKYKLFFKFNNNFYFKYLSFKKVLKELLIYRAQKKAGVNESSNMTTLVVGNPLLPNCLNEQLNLNELPHTEQEASMVAEMLQTKPLIKAEVNKTYILFYLFIN